MGMLAGFLVGATDEYGKQRTEQREEERDVRKEGRENAYTDIRDKRLAEITKSEGKLDRESREQISRDRPFSASPGSGVLQYSDKTGQYEVTDQIANRPTAGTTPDTDEMPIARSNGQPTTYKQLYNEWHKMKYTKDEFGAEVGNPDIANWEDWVNGQVQEQYRINPQQAEEVAATTASTASVQQATKEAEKINSGITPLKTDEEHFGGLSQDEWIQKRALEIEKEGPAAKVGGKAGMLAEGTEQAAKKPPQESTATSKIQLSSLAKIDPTTMWFELKKITQDDDTSEDEIIQEIRRHFVDPEWEPPTD